MNSAKGGEGDGRINSEGYRVRGAGGKAMQDLSETVSKLADKVERMNDATNARFAALELDIRELKNAIEALIRRIDVSKPYTVRKE